MHVPRIVVAAPASGHGKTTVATGLMAALRAAGHEVSPHKVGPDYIDPGYHSLASGRPGRNLDPHLVGEDLVVPLFLHGFLTPTPADVAVVEGVMGLYDGALGRDGFASTAHVAAELDAPVLLVVDISHASRSIGALVHGMATFDPAVRIAGVVLNKAGSHRHAAEAQGAVEDLGIPVLGVLHRDDGISAPSRHLGLVPVAERPDAVASVDRLAARVAEHVDVAAILDIARAAPDLEAVPWDPARALADLSPELSAREGASAPQGADQPVVAMAGGRAFTFRYPETEELLRAAGCRVEVFDPTTDEALPAGTSAIYLGGGFPEMHAAALGGNTSMLKAVRDAVERGVPTVAECAGLLYLCRTVDGEPMSGAIPAAGAMTPSLTLGYRTVKAHDTLITREGERVTGHEFHRTTVLPASGTPAWTVGDQPAGFGSDSLHASYLHTHWAGFPHLAARFAAAAAAELSARAGARTPRGADNSAGAGAGVEVGLRHHGDQEVGPGLVDLAVNVHPGPRPEWLDRALRSSLDDLAAYPDATGARTALAARHGRLPEEVLPTAGGAEAFTLVARMRPWARPVVVHPQFTEPEVALAAAGHGVTRVLLRAEEGFVLDPALVPEDADLVVVGNPTNPTGVLHPRAALEALIRPGRVLVVDEAFMDAVPGEPESMVGTPGVLVLRSLTKTWALPGVRAGYVVGDAALVAELARQQPPWSVSTTAAAAMVACCSVEAGEESCRRAELVVGWRVHLVEALSGLGLEVAGDPVAPFVLVRGPLGLRERLRNQGFAVRRGDSFPGLGPEWVRIAARDPETTDALVAAVAGVLVHA